MDEAKVNQGIPMNRLKPIHLLIYFFFPLIFFSCSGGSPNPFPSQDQINQAVQEVVDFVFEFGDSTFSGVTDCADFLALVNSLRFEIRTI